MTCPEIEEFLVTYSESYKPVSTEWRTASMMKQDEQDSCEALYDPTRAFRGCSITAVQYASKILLIGTSGGHVYGYCVRSSRDLTTLQLNQPDFTLGESASTYGYHQPVTSVSVSKLDRETATVRILIHYSDKLIVVSKRLSNIGYF